MQEEIVTVGSVKNSKIHLLSVIVCILGFYILILCFNCNYNFVQSFVFHTILSCPPLVSSILLLHFFLNLLSYSPCLSSSPVLLYSPPPPKGVGGCSSLRSISWWGGSWVQPEPFFCLHNAEFSLTLIKVHLASKCCGPLNTDSTERRKWKRQSKPQRQSERKESWETERWKKMARKSIV